MEANTSSCGDRTADDDEVVEKDPEERYYRYREAVGKGRFKQVWKAFDTHLGIDVAWSKINADISYLQLSSEQLAAVVSDIQKGLVLEHPNIIKSFKCWKDYDSHTINLVTELFTSGNLRQYRNLHKQLDLKAVKRMARQILRGLHYLHGMAPPVTHGDLRCDKIYVNGHSGEIKIGDLGLATLLPYRWQSDEEQQGPDLSNPNAQELLPQGPYDTATDIFAFGLCLLELLTLRQLDPQHCTNFHHVLSEVPDEESRQFVAKCVAPVPERPSAQDLLADSFLSVQRSPASQDTQETVNQTGMSSCGRSMHVLEEKPPSDESKSESKEGAPIAVGKLRGEDYNFEFQGKMKDNKMHFRLVMTEATSNDEQQENPGYTRTIDFEFDPVLDTADNLAAEIADNFNLSPTDTELCAAALREWLAKELPGTESQE